MYILCLKNGALLPGVTPGPRDVLYIGMTEDGLDVRNHFNSVHSGFSSPRRSFGALLKDKLALTAIQRGSGPSKTNFRCYRFSDEQEQQLSEWMRENLLGSQVQITENVAALERTLIKTLQPPLNLKGWHNPQRGFIKDRRALCAREAEGEGNLSS